MHATGFLRGYRLLLLRPSRGEDQRQERFSPLFSMSKSYPLFLVHPPDPCYVSQTKFVCKSEHQPHTRTYTTCTSTRTIYVDVPELSPSGLGTQPLVMLLCFFSGAVIAITTPRLSYACDCHVSIHVRTYLPKFNN